MTTPAIAGQAIVVDSDTLEIAGTKYRLHVIDTPKAGQKCLKAIGGAWKCGGASTEALKRIIQGEDVSCNDKGQDDFNRTIAVLHGWRYKY